MIPKITNQRKLSQLSSFVKPIVSVDNLDLSRLNPVEKDSILEFCLRKIIDIESITDEAWWNAIIYKSNQTKIQEVCEEVIAEYFKFENGRRDFYGGRRMGQFKPSYVKSGHMAFLLYGILHRVFQFPINYLIENYNANVKNYRDRWKLVFDKVSNTDSDSFSLLSDKIIDSSWNCSEQDVWKILSDVLPLIKDRCIKEAIWEDIFNSDIFN